MKYTRSGMAMLCLSLAVIGGCQQRQQPAKTLTAQNINQLAALIASAEWLRDSCQRSDIPPRSVIETTAVDMAKQRGWAISTLSQTQLNNAVEQRYLAISEDSEAMVNKCSQLNQAAAPFIQQAISTAAANK